MHFQIAREGLSGVKYRQRDNSHGTTTKEDSFHIREKVGEALKELESEGIIEPVPTTNRHLGYPPS